MSNSLVAISTWMCNRQLMFDMYGTKPLICHLDKLLQHSPLSQLMVTPFIYLLRPNPHSYHWLFSSFTPHLAYQDRLLTGAFKMWPKPRHVTTSPATLLVHITTIFCRILAVDYQPLSSVPPLLYYSLFKYGNHSPIFTPKSDQFSPMASHFPQRKSQGFIMAHEALHDFFGCGLITASSKTRMGIVVTLFSRCQLYNNATHIINVIWRLSPYIEVSF